MAYGYLKGETGMHRLVRISPFNSEGKRQTSFAAVDVSPEISDSVEIELRDEDIREDVFRASGAGGQHVNKTSSAIRLTHLPTDIVVQCQNERSQHKNRATALKMLRARLARLEEEKREAAQAAKYRRQGQDRLRLADPQLLSASRSAGERRPHGLLRRQFSKRAGRQHPGLSGCVPALARRAGHSGVIATWNAWQACSAPTKQEDCTAEVAEDAEKKISKQNSESKSPWTSPRLELLLLFLCVPLHPPR